MPVTASQFGRAVQIEIVPAVGDGVLINPNTAPGSTQLRCAVEVTKGIGQPATATAQVWGLTRETQARAAGITRRVGDFSSSAAKLDGRVAKGPEFGDSLAEQSARANNFGYLNISAFYQGGGTTVSIFEGSTTAVDPDPQPPEQITKITGGDGVFQAATAITARQWGETTSAAIVLEYVIRKVMGAGLAGAQPGNFGAGLPANLATFGIVGGYDATRLYATDILDEFARVTRTEWWWDDGTVYWLPKGQPLADPPILLDSKPQSGTYQILDRLQPTEGGVLASMLLLPQLRPGRLVTIGSGDYRGQWYARTVRHRADNRGSEAARTTARLARVGVLPF